VFYLAPFPFTYILTFILKVRSENFQSRLLSLQVNHHQAVPSLHQPANPTFMFDAATDDSSPEPPASITPTATGVSARFKNMDIGDTFREEDLSKTDFFDFVTSPPAVPTTMGEGEASVARVGVNQPPATLERFEQVSY
jgi:hypothetical protein